MAEFPSTLVAALNHNRSKEGRGFTFVNSDREETYLSYDAIYREAERRAAHLQALGHAKGDRIALVIPDGQEFVLSFFGASLAGLVPVPIFPRATFKALEGYIDTVAHIVEAAGAKTLITTESTKQFVEKVLERDTGLERICVAEEGFVDDPPSFSAVDVSPEDLCFLQFTSGSTSKPKGVMVTHSNLVANATAFLGPHGLHRNDQDVGVSWLPLYHDMGLIGFVLGTTICDIPVVLLPTPLFARMPRIWLETIAKHRGTITYAPNFAYDLAAKRVRDRDLEALDLSTLRVAGCGAEPIRAKTLQAFADKLAPAGFNASALLPSYGMAEATLAITFHQLGTPMIVDRVDPVAMQEGHAKRAADNADDVLELVSCGVEFPEHEVRIVDQEGAQVGEREVGELIVRGPSITNGYFKNETATREAWREGFLHTGDLAYRAEGNIYICGRVKDLIIINGANHYPQDIEWVVGDLEGVRRGNVVAFSVMRDNIEKLVIVAESNRGDAERLRKEIAQTVATRFGLQTETVGMVPVGTLPKTSSGKAQRRKSRQLFEDGDFPLHS